jgi:hypothetical protein
MQLIKEFVKENSTLLFKHVSNKDQVAIFDSKGFLFTEEAQTKYNEIKNQPHLYVAWTNNQCGYYYVGKSFQNGGRWKRQHAYHLGTLAHHFLNTIRYDDQNHSHWIDHWMNAKSMDIIDENLFSVELKDLVYISFIPFRMYSNQDFDLMDKKSIRQVNSDIERHLIQSYRAENVILLNVQHN